MRWPKWFDEHKRYCPSKSLVVWLKRVTGIGYENFPPLSEVIEEKKPIADEEKAIKRLKEKSNAVREEIEQLEKELRRLGIRNIPHHLGDDG